MKTRKDFEKATYEVRALPMKERRGKALDLAREFKGENPNFDAKRFFAACMVDLTDSDLDKRMHKKSIEMGLRDGVEFTIFYRWNDCDVDAALVPHLSNMCGRVIHEVGKADLLGGGYETGPAHKTPIDEDVIAIAHHWARQDNCKWPKGIESIGGYPHFIQGYCDAIFRYTGPLHKLSAVIEECKAILAQLIDKHVRYHGEGDKIRNRLVNVYAGTGSDIQRIE